jgi:hypothetical protein
VKKSMLDKINANLDRAIEPRRQPVQNDNSDSIAQRYAVKSSPVNPSGPLSETGPSNLTGPVIESPAAPPISGPPDMTGPVIESGPVSVTSPLLTIPDVDGFTKISHRYTDHLCQILTPNEQAVFFQLTRLTWGWNKETCFISVPRLGARSNLSESTTRRTIGKLAIMQLIEIVERKFGDGEQGIVFRVVRLDGPARLTGPLNVTPNKEKVLKEQVVKEPISCAICQNTGWFYPDPNDPSKGTKKCDHKGQAPRES